MALPLYLALTAAEFASAAPIPEHLAYMACHFSPYSAGLSNLPAQLPKEAILMVNDRIPISGHDPELICSQLNRAVSQLRPAAVLLDFQRTDCPETAVLTEYLLPRLSCPVAVAAPCCAQADCPVLLPPLPLLQTLTAHLAPWAGREIWLEAGLDCQCLTLMETGAVIAPELPSPGEYNDPDLFCHYRAEVLSDRIHFHLTRTRQDLDALLAAAEAAGVRLAVGLLQELG